MTDITTAMDPRTAPIQEREIKGLNFRTAAAILFGMITIEATLMGVYYGIKESIKDVNYTNAIQDRRMDLVEDRIEKIEAKQELLILYRNADNDKK